MIKQIRDLNKSAEAFSPVTLNRLEEDAHQMSLEDFSTKHPEVIPTITKILNIVVLVPFIGPKVKAIVSIFIVILESISTSGKIRNKLNH